MQHVSDNSAVLDQQQQQWTSYTTMRQTLHYAAIRGDVGLLRGLLRMQASGSTTSTRNDEWMHDSQGRLPLHYASMHDNPAAAMVLIEFCWRKSTHFPAMHPRNMVCTPDLAGNTPIHVAAERGRSKVLILLFQCCIDSPEKILGLRNELGQTPFHLACIAGNEDCLESLLHLGSNPLSMNADGMGAVHVASMVGSARILREVIRIALALRRRCVSSSSSSFAPDDTSAAAHGGGSGEEEDGENEEHQQQIVELINTMRDGIIGGTLVHWAARGNNVDCLRVLYESVGATKKIPRMLFS